VTRNPWEPRPENSTANRSVPSGPVPWNNSASWTYWSAFITLRNKVTGNFTGTTDEIIQWAACKWGIDENLIRAEATLESHWVQSTQGDFANGRYHSFGLMQVSQDDANGNVLKGGYPSTAQDTALNVDYYGSELRACFEGAFWDGGGWLYGASQVKGDLWGCVGYWYSGDWYDAGAQNYIAQVKNYYNTKPWIGWGYPGK
jgi:autotransporter family porin